MHRTDFPILSRTIRDRPLIYLDNAATSHKPQTVIDAISHYYTTENANIHRGIHFLSEEATRSYEETRERVKRFFNVPEDYEVVFTRGSTESINIVAAGIHTLISSRREIVVSMIEHHANFVPWQQAAERLGWDFTVMDVNGGFAVERISERTALAAVTMLSNVTGEVTDYHRAVARAREMGALTLLDASQAAPHLLLDVESVGADFVAITAHKMLGPTGLGMLIARKDLLAQMPPFEYGGEMIESVSIEKTHFADPPHRFEAGTMPIAQVAGLNAALEYLERIGKAQMRRHEHTLVEAFDAALANVDARIIRSFPGAERIPIVSLHADAHPHDIAVLLDEEGIAVRSGHHCAMPYMTYLGIPGTLRASAYFYTEREEVEAFAAAYARALEKLR